MHMHVYIYCTLTHAHLHVDISIHFGDRQFVQQSPSSAYSCDGPTATCAFFRPQVRRGHS